MEFETPPRTTKPVNEPAAQVTVGLRASNDTLTTADRLEIPRMQFEAPQPVSSSEPMPPADQTAIVAPRSSSNTSAALERRRFDVRHRICGTYR